MTYPLALEEYQLKNALRYPITNKAPADRLIIRIGALNSRGISITPSKLPIANKVIVPEPKTSLIRDMRSRLKVNPIPIPSASSIDTRTPFWFAKPSALPRMIQLTTIKGTNTPRLANSEGMYACMTISTIVTKDAIITIYDGILTFVGIKSFNNATKILEKVNTNITPAPIPRALMTMVETPKVGHNPRRITNMGFSLKIPFVNSFNISWYLLTVLHEMNLAEELLLYH